MLADAGDRIGALTAINAAIALRDDNASYFMLLASIQFRAGQPADAFLAAKRALELDAANVDALTLVANLGMQVGQVDDASAAADRLLALDANSMIGLQVKGLNALSKNKVDEANATAERLLTLNPTDVAGTIIRARVLAKAGKYDEALALVDRNLAGTQQASPPLLITKINLYRVLKRPDDMLHTFDQLAQQVPDRAISLRLDQINTLYKQGLKDRARAESKAMLESGAMRAGDLDVLQRLWWQYDPVPFDRETIKTAEKWRDPVMMLNVGRYLLWQDQPQLTDDLYFSFPESARPAGTALHLRAVFGLGRIDEARFGTDALLKADPDNVDALLLRAGFEAQAGHLDLAIEAAQRAMNSDQTDPEVYVVLAQLHAKAGASWRAAQVFEDGLRLMPQSYLLIDRYTQFLHDSGNKSRAVSVSRAFARAQPSSVLAWTVMAKQCAWAADAACAAAAAAGRTAAATSYLVDDAPGTPPDRGLLGKF